MRGGGHAPPFLLWDALLVGQSAKSYPLPNPALMRAYARVRPQAADPQAVDDLSAYLQARAEWIPNYRARRRQRRFIGNGLGEKANDRIVARRQKRTGMQWSVETSDALTALRTLLLNEGWDTYWQQRRPFYLETA